MKLRRRTLLSLNKHKSLCKKATHRVMLDGTSSQGMVHP